jgi:hypothetical protein
VDDEVASRLDLDRHPMVTKVHGFLQDGYRIRASRGPNARRPYGKVFLFKGQHRCTVQVDGSVKEGWD